MFEAVLTRVRALGFLQKRGKQRTDALGVVGAVRELSQLELVWEALRLALRALLAADAGLGRGDDPGGVPDAVSRAAVGLSADG